MRVISTDCHGQGCVSRPWCMPVEVLVSEQALISSKPAGHKLQLAVVEDGGGGQRKLSTLAQRKGEASRQVPDHGAGSMRNGSSRGHKREA